MTMNKFLFTSLMMLYATYSFAHIVAHNTLKWTTSNGVQVVFYPTQTDIPMLDIDLAFAAGSAYDGKYYGLSALATRLMSQGSGRKNATQIAEEFANVGAQYESYTDRDVAVFHVRTLTHEIALNQVVSTFAAIINSPSFPYDAFYRERARLLMAIRAKQESPEQLAEDALYSALYNNHPYGHPIDGTQSSVQTLSNNLMRQFYKQYFVASNNAVLVMVGAISVSQAHAIAEHLLEKLAKGKPAALIPVARPLAHAVMHKIAFSAPQMTIILAQLGINHQSSTYFPLLVGNYILGGGNMISRLATEIREKRGLTYSISSQLTLLQARGPFFISFATKTTQTQQALQHIGAVLEQFVKHGPTEKALRAAKHYLNGSFPLSLAGNHQLAMILLHIAFYHLPNDYLTMYLPNIDAITSNDIQAAFAKLVNTQPFIQIQVGKVRARQRS